MDTSVLARACRLRVIAKIRKSDDPWPYAAQSIVARRVPLIGINRRGQNMHETDFVNKLTKDINWRVLSGSDIKKIVQHIDRVNDSEVISRMMQWESRGQTRQAQPRMSVISALVMRQRELGGGISPIEESEVETIEVR